MKHAILVIGHGSDASVLQGTIRILDDKDIDFIIHWDKKYPKPKLAAVNSKIFFIKSIEVEWGTFSQIQVEKNLLKYVYNAKNYDYVHLISSTDMPLMNIKHFKKFFVNDMYLGFKKDGAGCSDRISYYYPDFSVNLRSILGKILIRVTKCFNQLFRVNRLKNWGGCVKKGANWFSMRSIFIPEVLAYDISVFQHSYLADEVYLQTILAKYESTIDSYGYDPYDAARYIDWDRGNPYVFTMTDVPELKSVLNTKYAFARKVNDVRLINVVFADYN